MKFFFFFDNPSGRQCLSRESVWCPWTEAIETASWGENTRARVPWVSPAFTSKCCKGKSVFCCENANHTRWLGMSISFANTRNRTTSPPFLPSPLSLDQWSTTFLVLPVWQWFCLEPKVIFSLKSHLSTSQWVLPWSPGENKVPHIWHLISPFPGLHIPWTQVFLRPKSWRRSYVWV